MNLPRFYCGSLKSSVVELSTSESHHLFNVCRLGKGDKVELFDGSGSLAVAVITATNKRRVSLQIENVQTVSSPAAVKVIIAVSIAKGERFDWLIGKCTEFGVDRICPVIFERTVKLSQNPHITDRWQNLAITAAKQCRRVFLPGIDKPKPLVTTLNEFKKDYSNSLIYLGEPSPGSPPLISTLSDLKDLIAFVGPEGGLSENEIALLRDNGVKFVRLTNTVLRVETAALAFAAILTARRDAALQGG